MVCFGLMVRSLVKVFCQVLKFLMFVFLFRVVCWFLSVFSKIVILVSFLFRFVRLRCSVFFVLSFVMLGVLVLFELYLSRNLLFVYVMKLGAVFSLAVSGTSVDFVAVWS